VESNEDVIAFGEWFDLPPQSARMRLVHADARDYFAHANADAPADVILMDGCDERGTAPEFRSGLFYENLRMRLRPRGILVVNMAGSVERQRSHRRLIAHAFAGRVIVVDVNDCGNRLAFAFNDTSDFPDLRSLVDRADRLEHQHGLDFREFARLLLRGYCKTNFQSGDVARQTYR
jgi:spermidine synthase